MGLMQVPNLLGGPWRGMHTALHGHTWVGHTLCFGMHDSIGAQDNASICHGCGWGHCKPCVCSSDSLSLFVCLCSSAYPILAVRVSCVVFDRQRHRLWQRSPQYHFQHGV